MNDTYGGVIMEYRTAQLERDFEIINARGKVLELRDEIGSRYLALSGLLFQINEDRMYESWGFDSFSDYVENEVGFKLRKAQYLCSIWRKFVVEMSLPYTEVEKVGWSKLKELTGVVNEENVGQVLRSAESHTIDELKNAVRTKEGSVAEELGIDSTEEEVIRMDRTQRLTTTLVGEQIDVVEQALVNAKRAANSDKINNLISLICLEYNANYAGQRSLQFFLERIEEAYGVRLVAFDENNDLVFGIDTLQSLGGDESD